MGLEIARMHIIPWALLSKAIGIEGPATDPTSRVTMSNRLFRIIMEAALAHKDFDTAAYLEANPDVAGSIRDGSCPSAQEHYATAGYYEGRASGDGSFDEAWYLNRYPDVRRAILAEQSASGADHYNGPGRREWRSPNRAAETEIARWHHAVTEAAGAVARPPPPAKRRAAAPKAVGRQLDA